MSLTDFKQVPSTAVEYELLGTDDFKKFQDMMWSAYEFPNHIDFEGTEGSSIDRFVFPSLGEITLDSSKKRVYLNPEVDRESRKEIYCSQLEGLFSRAESTGYKLNKILENSDN